MANKENIRKWVDALRSGKYRQASGTLCSWGSDDVPSYCCLGVACEVAMKNGVKLDKIVPSACSGWPVTYSGKDQYLPEAVAEWLGIKSEFYGGPVAHGMYVNEYQIDPICNVQEEDEEDGTNRSLTCTEMNDRKGWTFGMIAYALENTFLT